MAKIIYLKGNYEFKITKNTFGNNFYTWRQTAKIFSWYSIFDNSRTKDNTIYLKDVENKYIYNANTKEYHWHRHICWMSNFNINRMRFAKHFYIYFTYIATKEYYQLCIIMYFDETANKKIPGVFLLINNKFESSYILALKAIKNLLTINDTINISLESITCYF